jgi:CHASE3 domain sensor protein
MQIPIFWRIMSGYALILFLFVGASSYSVIQLGGLSRTAHVALDTDNRMISYEEKLTDAFMSEARYSGQFLIIHTEALNEQFRQFNTDFNSFLSELEALAETGATRARLRQVKELHDRYHELFAQEVRYVKAGQRYAESRFQAEREKLFESTLRELEELKRQLQAGLHQKLQAMERVADTARTITAVMMIVLLAIGVTLSLFISRSITVPLLILKRSALSPGTEDCAGSPDNFPIPEIHALSDALLLQNSTIREAAAANAAFVESVTEHFTTPLISINKRIAYIKDALGATLPVEHLLTFKILNDETERMIKRCEQLPSPAKLPFETALCEPANGRSDTEIPRPYAVSWVRSARDFLARILAAVNRTPTPDSGKRRWIAISQTARWRGSAKGKRQ